MYRADDSSLDASISSRAAIAARSGRVDARILFTSERILRQNSLAQARFTQQAKRGRRLLIEAVVLTEAVVGFAVRRRMVESASTVVLAEKTIPIPVKRNLTETPNL